jgi:hypothetical protein
MILGGVYEWLDTDVVPDTTYYYKLEDIDLKGVSTFHGPVSSIIVDAPAAVELRSVAAHGAILTLLPGLAIILGLAVTYVYRRRHHQT